MGTLARAIVAVLLTGVFAVPPGLGAQTNQGAPGKAAQPPQAQPVQAPKAIGVDDLPPQIKLGIRSELVRRQMPVAPTVVIVREVRSYVAALGRWTTDNRFPVLIDDGTWEARENIARFVRAFNPKTVVRWEVAAETIWPLTAAEQQQIIEGVVAHAWGAKDWASFPERLKNANTHPMGVVAASMSDPAWTAAVALAAGHGQIIAWVTAPTNVNGNMSMREADQLTEQITQACTASGVAWDSLGDPIDAVTLCLAVPAKVTWQAEGGTRPQGPIAPVPGEPVATTDLIGRHPRGDRMNRWAWCGQIFGSEAQAAYMAMCSLFAAPRRAWVFDGYESNAPFSFFDGTEAANLLKKSGFSVDLDDAPRQSIADWRDRTAGSWLSRPTEEKDRKPVGCLDASFICVNTMGMSESFDLKPGQAVSGDIPFLDVPAMVHFVHSWSAQYPASRATVAGRWLERGAYAYVGSVHEPYLQAFQPTPIFVKRFMAPLPFGVAPRLDDSPPWRIAVFGDPLLTIGPPAPAAEKEIPLNAMIDFREALGEELRAGRFEAAFANLLLCGRDADLVRLAKASMQQDPAKVSPAAAALALGAALRRADLGAFVALYPRAAELTPPSPIILDMAWHALRPAQAMLTLEQAQLLGKAIRPASYQRDVEDVARMIRRLGGDKARRQWLEALMAATTDSARKQVIDGLLAPSPR